MPNIVNRRAMHQAARVALLVLLVICLLASALGCGARKGEEPLPTADQVIARHLDAQKQVTTFRSDISAYTDMQVGDTQSNRMTMSMMTKGAFVIFENPARLSVIPKLAALSL
jgi:predicted small lipoprotein YifL